MAASRRMTHPHPEPPAPRRRRPRLRIALGGALLCCAIALFTACEGSPEPTPEPPEQTIEDPKWVTAAIEAGFPSDLVPWLADPRNRGTLPSSPDLRSRYVNALADLSPRDRVRFLMDGLGWSRSVYYQFYDKYLPTPIPWQKQWLAHSEGGANGVVTEATTVRGSRHWRRSADQMLRGHSVYRS